MKSCREDSDTRHLGTLGREFAVVPGGWEPFPGHVKGWEGERAGKTLAPLSPWCPGPPWARLRELSSP